MKLLHEEYTDLSQLLDEMPAIEAMALSASYFTDQAEDSFGLESEPTETDHNIMARFSAKEGQ